MYFTVAFVIEFKIQNEQGLKQVGAVLLPGFADTLHHKGYSAKLFGITMDHETRFTVPGGMKNDSPGLPDHNVGISG